MKSKKQLFNLLKYLEKVGGYVMDTIELVCLLFMLSSIIFLIVGLFFIYWWLDIKKNGVEVLAIVTKEATSDEGPSIKYTCLNGENIKKKYIFSNSFMPLKYKNHQSIKVMYKPDKPKKVWIVGDKTPLILGGASIGAFILGSITCIILIIVS